MAKHEFGIFETEPEPGKRYDEYSPEKYDCITIHDDYIEPLLGQGTCILRHNINTAIIAARI
ncbi:MAG TPA: hypothetical protein VEF53_08785 [Patescibacteria group bacterium]|nr:hypothetical protein [Patescibacteria group bacterium]